LEYIAERLPFLCTTRSLRPQQGYSVGLFNLLNIHHAMCMRCIVICGLSRSTFFPHYLIKGTTFFFLKKLYNTKCVFWFSIQLLSETLFTPRRNERDKIKNV